MKHIFVFIITALLMTFFSVFTLFATEITDVLKLGNQNISVTFAQEGYDTVMNWTPLDYPCTYKVETFTPATGLVRGVSEYHHLTTQDSLTSSYIVPRAPIPTFYKISARGFFKEFYHTDIIAEIPTSPIRRIR